MQEAVATLRARDSIAGRACARPPGKQIIQSWRDSSWKPQAKLLKRP